MTYTQLLNETITLYCEGKYLEAYSFLTENYKEVQGNMAQIYNFRYAIASKAGLYEEAIKLMKEAILEKGHWYSYSYLQGDEDLDALRSHELFDQLCDICKKREELAVKQSLPQLKLVEPSHQQKAYPLVIGLHGNEENMAIAEYYWKNFKEKGYLLALPQSSEIKFDGGYYWNDIEKGYKELGSHYTTIVENFKVQQENVILGGFSSGARVSLYFALHSKVKIKGLILIAPWLPEIEQWLPLLGRLKETKVYIVCGEDDVDCLSETEALVKALEQTQIDYIYEKVAHLGHDFPIDFNTYIEKILTFTRESTCSPHI